MPQLSDYNPELSGSQRDDLFHQILQGIDDPRKFISGWFMGASPEEVYRENLTEWMLWAFFNQHSREAYQNEENGKTAQVVDRYLDAWEQHTGMAVTPGYNPKVKCIRLNSDPVKTIHRPACVYIVSGDMSSHKMIKADQVRLLASFTISSDGTSIINWDSVTTSHQENLDTGSLIHTSVSLHGRPTLF